ncbi:sugar kinase [Piscinibacter terrae]|uniref:Sugar kinase n=1 Tax=Piscinibacter terrae TaxID=2496871 RepID=A0A3N7HML3_9BURK|nr:sugar kinase [Albitalea terrae]RQP23360.1 sugar kinase [Albitalea terrae]
MKTLDIVALGEPLVEFNQDRADPTAYRAGFGGDTSNCAVAAARLGARTAYMTQVGDDSFGMQLMQMWQREGVDVSGVRVVQGADTGLYFVTHGAEGHQFTYRRSGSAASRMSPGEIDLRGVAAAKFLHCSGISQAISESARATVSEAMRMARSAGTRVSFDLNFRPRLWTAERALQALLETLPLCDIFFPSVDEVALLTGLTQVRDIVDWSHVHGARTVVLKLGAQGSVVSEGGSVMKVPPHRVQPVDATGAGDCFAGACLARLCAGDDLRQAVRVANIAAALSTQGYGAIAPLPRWPEIEPLLEAPVAD